MQCYNCGIELTEETKTKEHIPAKAYFAGFDDKYKENRITVPACRKCNEEYSSIDQEIRDAVGISYDEDGNEEFVRKSAKSVLRKKGRKDRVILDENNKIVGVEFDYEDFKKSAIKDFKGIFYEKYGYPIPENWKIEIIAQFEDEHNLVNAALGLYAYLKKDTNWSKSGHEDIFKYIIKTLVPDKDGNISDTGEIEKAESIVSVQDYHDRIMFIVVAAKNRTLNKLRPNKKKRRIKKHSSKNRKSKNQLKAKKIQFQKNRSAKILKSRKRRAKKR